VGEADVTGTEGLAENRPVGKVGSEESLEEETEVHGRIAHALLADREPAGLADEEVSPLHDDDAHPEGTLSVVEGLLLGHAREDVDADGVQAVLAAARRGVARVGRVELVDGVGVLDLKVGDVVGGVRELGLLKVFAVSSKVVMYG